jgi:hypothetical protein
VAHPAAPRACLLLAPRPALTRAVQWLSEAVNRRLLGECSGSCCTRAPPALTHCVFLWQHRAARLQPAAGSVSRRTTSAAWRVRHCAAPGSKGSRLMNCSCRAGLRCFYHSSLQRDSRRVNLRPLASVGGRPRVGSPAFSEHRRSRPVLHGAVAGAPGTRARQVQLNRLIYGCCERTAGAEACDEGAEPRDGCRLGAQHVRPEGERPIPSSQRRGLLRWRPAALGTCGAVRHRQVGRRAAPPASSTNADGALSGAGEDANEVPAGVVCGGVVSRYRTSFSFCGCARSVPSGTGSRISGRRALPHCSQAATATERQRSAAAGPRAPLLCARSERTGCTAAAPSSVTFCTAIANLSEDTSASATVTEMSSSARGAVARTPCSQPARRPARESVSLCVSEHVPWLEQA